ADGSRGLVVVPVSYRETGDARAYLQSIGVTIPAIVDPNDSIGEAYGVEDLPVTVWVGRDGKVAQVVVGQLTQRALDDELAALLPRAA
ncbi:MAG TPA: TlpA disulfide reductase family protein, partial [Candidatus Dormibacteraeota bacterium]|nr:TlpA disulfide reductase family protein [Candidatus Dormibacteraeota bacterium]